MYHFDDNNTTTTNNNDYYCNNIIEDVARLLIRFTVYKHVAFSYNIILGCGFDLRLRRRSFQL